MRITSDGTPSGTKVTTDDGVDITKDVIGINWEISMGRLATVTLQLNPTRVQADIKAAEPKQPTRNMMEIQEKPDIIDFAIMSAVPSVTITQEARERSAVDMDKFAKAVKSRKRHQH